MDAERALELIVQHGIFGLSESNGCVCAHFSVMGIDVDVSCRKSSGSMFKEHYGIVLRVTSSHLDSNTNDLTPIAQECARQLSDEGSVLVRFCDYDDDAKCRCVYCGQKRESPRAVLCNKCATGLDCWGRKIADKYSTAEMLVPAA